MTNDETISFEVGAIDNSEAREATWRAWRHIVVKNLVLGAVLFGLVLTTAIAERSMGIAAWGCILLLAAFIIIGSIIGADVLIQAAKIAKSSPTEITKYDLSTATFAFTGKNASVQLSWSLFERFATTRNLFLIRLQGSKAWLIVPRRCLSEDQGTKLLRILAANSKRTLEETPR